MGNHLSAGVWYHFAVTYDGANVKLYLNGILKDTEPATGNLDTSTRALVLGKNGAVNERYLDGLLDEARISSEDHSADWILTEVNNVNNQGIGSGKFIKNLGEEENVNSLYRSVGTTATALASGNCNALTISGSTATFGSGLLNSIGVGDVIEYD